MYGQADITYHDWRLFFQAALPNSVRKEIVPCGALIALDDVLGVFAALSHGTKNNPSIPESFNQALFAICDHIFGTGHSIMPVPDASRLSDDELRAAKRILSALIEYSQSEIALAAYLN